jgi:hypothetical protein
MKVEKRLFVNGGKRCKEKLCVRVCRLCLSILEVRENIWVKTRKVILPLTVGTAEVGKAEVGTAEVWLYIWMFIPPLIPSIYPLFEDIELVA